MTTQSLTIIAIPFAGGNAYSYNFFERHLPSNFNLKTIELPGRGERMADDFIIDSNELAKDIVLQILKEIDKAPYIIYGHSLGTLIGYELTKEIIRKRYRVPLGLLFTGRSGPSVPEEVMISDYSCSAFWNEISLMGGLPPAVLANQELKDFFEPVLRSDFKIAETYKYVPMDSPFAIPISVIAGTNEKDITDETLGTWQNETSFPLYKQYMSGHHFFIHEHAASITRLMVTMLNTSSPNA
jgi:surfactin synthase thioesterase subunit